MKRIGVIENVFIDHSKTIVTLRLPLPSQTHTIGAAKEHIDGSLNQPPSFSPTLLQFSLLQLMNNEGYKTLWF